MQVESIWVLQKRDLGTLLMDRGLSALPSHLKCFLESYLVSSGSMDTYVHKNSFMQPVIVVSLL